MEKIIEVKRLVKVYGNIRAVDGVSFDVYRNEVFSLVGPNAAGKTTTVEILTCLRQPSSGYARVLGFDVLEDEAQIKKRIGVMPQDFNAFERLTVKENVELIMKIYGLKADVKPYLEKLGLWEIRNQKFHTLSGGMKRRVGICMALASDPEILFLDEPTTGLDPQARRECWKVIQSLKEMGKTVFLTTHYMEEAEKLSDRVAVIVNGRIVAIGDVKELIAKHGGGVKVIVKGGDEEAQKLLEEFTDNVYVDREGRVIGKFQTRREASEAALQLYQLSEQIVADVEEPTLEDVFLRLVGAKIDERGELA
ncbi:ABC transporter ATP-binding protein [Candidatus Bathyarchaeota archaeon]|nr:ABC transporter ATP-binding protein [Candidatus Bathyarchaeota archaeon]